MWLFLVDKVPSFAIIPVRLLLVLGTCFSDGWALLKDMGLTAWWAGPAARVALEAPTSGDFRQKQ